MMWTFGPYRLDSARAELTGPKGAVPIERLPLELLVLLAENAGRVVTKDEIIEALWGGRIVSDATLSTAVKQARKAVGDDGTAQSVIRTVHGRGFRFVAPLAVPAEPAGATPNEPAPDTIGIGRAALAVLRFQLMGADSDSATLADAIPAELINSLSRLRWLHVTARGSSFRLDPATTAPDEAARLLGIRYVLSGSIEAIGPMLTISVELVAAAEGRLVWSERYATTRAELPMARRNIVAAVISAMEIHVPAYEAEHARHLSPQQFDAWSHFHLGLRHMYRFQRPDNVLAAQHFRAALDLDPDFARAHAGLSFTHWQDAFMHFGEDRRHLLAQADASAARALQIDAHDPFASFNMGRARWLSGDIDAGRHWFDRALSINPNYAQCHYTRGMSQLLAGDVAPVVAAAETAIRLSPLDPLLYAMKATQALARLSVGDLADGRRLAADAIRQPGAHFYIEMIHAAAEELSGDHRRATDSMTRARTSRPNLSQAMFFQAFPFRDPGLRGLLSGAFSRLGLA